MGAPPLVRLDERAFVWMLPPVAVPDIPSLDSPELEREMKRIALDEASVAPHRFDPDRDGWWMATNSRSTPTSPNW